MRMRALFIFFIVTVLLGGCSTKEAAEERVASDVTAVDNTVSSEEETKEKEKTKGNDSSSQNVWINGEITVAEDEIVYNGKSNLQPGTIISSRGASTISVAQFKEQTEVKEDGSFQFIFPDYDGSAKLTFEVYANATNEEFYGEGLKNANGSQVYKTNDKNRDTILVYATLDEDKEKPYTINIEPPEWKEPPADIGDTEVWMENVEVTSDHEYLYVTGDTNLLEGVSLSFMRKSAEDNIVPFSGGTTRIHPDGTFAYKERYTSLHSGMYFQIKAEPSGVSSWDHIVETYGENFEHLTGDIMEKEGGTQLVMYKASIEDPEMSPPDGVDMTVNKEEVKLQVYDELLFGFDESTLKKEAEAVLKELIPELEQLPKGTVIHVNGHTDKEGDETYNQRLSEERASSVLSYLTEQGDLNHVNITSNGFGESKPIASNAEEKGRERNRRVEVVINPKDGI